MIFDSIVSIDPSDIKRVKLLGVRTSKETKIITTYNFATYSFWIEFYNGETKTIEISPDNERSYSRKKLFKYLMAKANELPQNTVDSNCAENSVSSSVITPARNQGDIFQDLKNVKDLFDSGVIPEEMYEQQKERLLAELSDCNTPEPSLPEPVQYNLTIQRVKPKRLTEEKTFLYVDGQKMPSVNLENTAELYLEDGKHRLSFKRGVVTSQIYDVELDGYTVCTIHLDTSGLKIKTECFVENILDN